MYVHPAYFEPWGVTVLEAMSAGIIPILTRDTGSSELLIKKRLDNLVVKDNQPQTLAAKISEVHDYSKARKLSISNKCRNIIKRGYMEKQGLDVFRRAFLNLIQ